MNMADAVQYLWSGWMTPNAADKKAVLPLVLLVSGGGLTLAWTLFVAWLPLHLLGLL